MKRIILALATCLTLSILAGCAGPKEPPPRSIKAIDQTVVATVRMNLKTDAELASSTIQVSAENELLVLRGSVPSEAAKQKAEEIALKTPRVEKVANHLEVSADQCDVCQV